jgi:hypothetical protein
MNYQVIPDNCNLLARSRQEDEFCRHLEFFKQNALSTESDESFQYLQELFEEFKNFYGSVSEHEGVLVWLS